MKILTAIFISPILLALIISTGAFFVGLTEPSKLLVYFFIVLIIICILEVFLWLPAFLILEKTGASYIQMIMGGMFTSALGMYGIISILSLEVKNSQFPFAIGIIVLGAIGSYIFCKIANYQIKEEPIKGSHF